jgi:hypothetical protein
MWLIGITDAQIATLHANNGDFFQLKLWRISEISLSENNGEDYEAALLIRALRKR